MVTHQNHTVNNITAIGTWCFQVVFIQALIMTNVTANQTSFIFLAILSLVFSYHLQYCTILRILQSE